MFGYTVVRGGAAALSHDPVVVVIHPARGFYVGHVQGALVQPAITVVVFVGVHVIHEGRKADVVCRRTRLVTTTTTTLTAGVSAMLVEAVDIGPHAQ